MLYNKQYLSDRMLDCVNASWPSSSDKSKSTLNGLTPDYNHYDEYRFIQGIDETALVWIGDVQGEKCVGLSIGFMYHLNGWILNFMTSQMDAPEFDDMPYGKKTSTGIEVHTGFHISWLGLEIPWFEYLEYAIKKGVKKIIITGYSRGGAVAQDAAVDTNKNYVDSKKIFNKEDVHVCLIDSPNFFNEAGADSYNRRVQNTLRIVNHLDPIPNMPPEWMKFRSVGKTVLMNWNKLTKYNLFYWLPNVTKNIPGVRFCVALSTLVYVMDHYPGNASKSINKYEGDIPQPI